MTGLMPCCLQGLICTAPFGMEHPILGLAMHGLGRVLRLRTHNQNRTVAARAIADMKTFGHLS